MSGSTAPFFRAGRAWLLAQVAGNLSTAWLIPSSSIAAFLFLLTGMAAAVVTMDERKRASETKPELSPAALARGRSLA